MFLSFGVRTLCAAWCTTASFNNPVVSCPLECGAAEGDRVLHVFACPAIVHSAAFALRMATINPNNPVASLTRALLPCHSACVALRCRFMCGRPAQARQSMALLTARVKEQVLRHPLCRAAVRL